MQASANRRLKEEGLPQGNWGWGTHAAVIRDRDPKEEARALCGSLVGVVERLLGEAPSDYNGPPPEILLVADGYNPRNPLRNTGKRGRLAAAVRFPGCFGATRLMTVVDRADRPYRTWLHSDFLSQLAVLRNPTSAQPVLAQHRPHVRAIAGDHLELWSWFRGVGSTAHRSVYCTLPCDQWLTHLWRCADDVTVPGLSQTFPAWIAPLVPDAVCVCPPLHDCKGLTEVVLHLHPDGPEAARAVGGTGACLPTNVTGTQARTILDALLRDSQPGVLRALLRCVDMFWYFRYQDIAPRFLFDLESSRRDPTHTPDLAVHRAFLFCLVNAHMFLFLLEFVHAGLSKGRGGAYMHSLVHWFDPARASFLTRIGDEAHEQENGQRKRFIDNCRPQDVEAELMLNELRRRPAGLISLCPDAPTRAPPAYLGNARMLLCNRCFAGRAIWRTAIAALKAKITRLGVHASLVHNPPPGACLHVGEAFPNHPANTAGMKLCVCQAVRPALSPDAQQWFKV